MTLILMSLLIDHQEQPLLLFRGDTPPDKPTPPSSPERKPAPRSLSSASSRESTPPEDKEMVYRRDLYRCCFTGQKLVRPIEGGRPNLQILHLFPAAKSYDPDGSELERLSIGSRHDIHNLFLGAYEFNEWLDSGSIHVTPDYIIHINDSEVRNTYSLLDGKSLLLPNHSARDLLTGQPLPCSSLSPQQLALSLKKFPPPEMFAWHMDFIQRTILLPRQFAALKLQNACCPDCKAQCLTNRCPCHKQNRGCTSCISSKCKNLATVAPVVPAPLSPDDKDDDDD